MSSSRIRKWLVPVGAAALMFAVVAFPATSFADDPSGCDFSPTNNGVPDCSLTGPLTPSTFEGGDGNLLVNTSGNTDWANVANLNPAFDLPSGTGDNSFGQGTKEDDPNVSVVTGSIPPNKSDLTRFYEASETVGGNTYLYLAWERTNVLGSANFDFEFNQLAQPNLTTIGKKTLNRSAGDLLVTYDFTNGGGRPTLGLLSWLTSATTPVIPGFATNSCLSAHSFPCWGDKIALTSANSIGAVNNVDSVTDPLFPSQPNYINPVPALQFGEAAINLTGSGLFPPGACEALNSAFVRSRSSASFTAEIKDFIAPIPVNISNCGALGISKVSSKTAATPLAGATFSVADKDGNVVFTGTTGSSGTLCVTKLSPGTYTVTETGAPTGYDIDTASKSATVSTGDTCASHTVTFTDTPLTDISASATSEVAGGTQSTITCTGTSTDGKTTATGSAGPGGSVTATDTGLHPGTYTCTIVVDP